MDIFVSLSISSVFSNRKHRRRFEVFPETFFSEVFLSFSMRVIYIPNIYIFCYVHFLLCPFCYVNFFVHFVMSIFLCPFWYVHFIMSIFLCPFCHVHYHIQIWPFLFWNKLKLRLVVKWKKLHWEEIEIYL